MGQLQSAMQEYRKAASLSHDSTNLSALAHAHAIAGEKGEAIKIVDELQSEAKDSYASPYEVAPVFAALGEKDRALSLLEQAFVEHDSRMPFLAVDSWLAPLHSDPRFVALERKVGLHVE